MNSKEFDWENKTAEFDKEKAMREAEERWREEEYYEEEDLDPLANSELFDSITDDLQEVLTNPNPEEAYDPSKSIFDTLSCDAFEKLQRKKTPQEDRRHDEETFGPITGPPINPALASGRYVLPTYRPGQRPGPPGAYGGRSGPPNGGRQGNYGGRGGPPANRSQSYYPRPNSNNPNYRPQSGYNKPNGPPQNYRSSYPPQNYPNKTTPHPSTSYASKINQPQKYSPVAKQQQTYK